MDEQKKQYMSNINNPKIGVSCSEDSLLFNGSLVSQINFCGKIPAIRVAAKL
jgi:hypothetical protein